MKKHLLPCMLALMIAVIFVGCGKETENKIVKVTVWVQLTNDSQENVYYWTGDNLTQTLVTVNSTATRQTQLAIESKTNYTYRFYLKKESSTLEYDKQSYYDIYVTGDKNPDVVEAIFSWDGTTLTRI
jgi:hypothetical protein